MTTASATPQNVKEMGATIRQEQHDWQAHVDCGIYPPRTHLFLDDFYIGTQQGLGRIVTPPDDLSRNDPVFRAEKDWEGVAVSCRCKPIIYDEQEQLFKFWYACQDPRIPANAQRVPVRWAYAISQDGVHWERPNLGLVQYHGSTDNNLLLLENVEGGDIAIVQNVTKDNRDPDPLRRYKAIGICRHAVRPGEITWAGSDGFDSDFYRDFGSKIGCGLFVSYSPDGLRWRMREGWLGSTAILADGSALHGFDPRINKWVMWQRPRVEPKYRIFGMSTSDDFEQWTFPVDALVPDENDPPGMQVDSLATIASPDAGYVGLAAMSGYAGEGFKINEKLPQLVYSRDGHQWTRVDRSPYLTVTGTDAWNGGPCITPCNPILVGDEIFIFYYGKSHGHLWGEPTLDGKGIVTSALGLAKLPRDRWVAMTPKNATGELITPMISFGHNELHVNADASGGGGGTGGRAGGSLVVELLDFEHKPIEGFTAADCDPITDDRLDHCVAWQGQSDLSRIIGTARMGPVHGRALRIRFIFDRSRLFTFSC